jgi:hypothetical protein
MSNDFYIEDWVKLYNFLNEKLECGNPPVDSVIFNFYRDNEVQICKNVKKDNTTTHFTLRENDIDVWDSLPPDRKAAREGHYTKHYPYYFYREDDKDF